MTLGLDAPIGVSVGPRAKAITRSRETPHCGRLMRTSPAPNYPTRNGSTIMLAARLSLFGRGSSPPGRAGANDKMSLATQSMLQPVSGWTSAPFGVPSRAVRTSPPTFWQRSPGPTSTRAWCWTNCPECVGRSARPLMPTGGSYNVIPRCYGLCLCRDRAGFRQDGPRAWITPSHCYPAGGRTFDNDRDRDRDRLHGSERPPGAGG